MRGTLLCRSLMFKAALLVLISVDNSIFCLGNHIPNFILEDGQSEIVLRLKEGPSTPAGSEIYTLRGEDLDGDFLTFGLISPSAPELLEVKSAGPTQAKLILKTELDRELKDEYMLVITLTDGKSEPVQRSLLILVEDKNDNSPVFKPFSSTVKVAENSAVPKTLVVVEATDQDEGPYGQVVYRLSNDQEDDGYFDVINKNGKAHVRLLKPLDYEKKYIHQIQLIASDRAETYDQINTAAASIIIHVLDEGDVGPQFVSVPPVTRIREGIPVSSRVFQVKAIDGDRGVNNPILYSLLNNKNIFGIDPTSGIVYTKSLIDREAVPGGSYVIKIKATEDTKDGTGPSTITETTVVITDIDDEIPRFRSREYLAEIVENSPAGVPVTFLASAVPECYDLDLGKNGTFKLLTVDDGGIFEVTPSQGINQVSFLIRVKNPTRLDYERLKEVNFTIVARSLSGEQMSSVPVSVRILDANDNNPVFEKEVYQIYLSENAKPGTNVAKIRATDADDGIYGTSGIRYTSLKGSLAEELSLDDVTGVIQVTRPRGNESLLDRELSPVYYVTVEARDMSGLGNRNKASIEIHLKDENDNSPSFLQSRYEARIFENAMDFVSPVRFQAKDADLQGTPNNEIHYSIVAGNTKNWLQVHELSGRVKVVRPFDFEALPKSFEIRGDNGNIKRLNFTVRANDNGNPKRFSLSLLTLYVHDVNDFEPTFPTAYVELSIKEDTVSGSQIARIRATDGDASSPFNKVFYRIENGAFDKFIINAQSGILRLAPGAHLDYNTRNKYSLQVAGIDGSGIRSPTPCIVNITIVDVNNKAPKFILNNSGLLEANVTENAAVGDVITRVQAIDPDSSAVLRYGINYSDSVAKRLGRVKLDPFNLHEKFTIDPISGEVKVKGALDRESIDLVELTVTVVDIASQTKLRETKTILYININDVNDNDPKFKKDPYVASIPENSKRGTAVLTVQAHDDDLDNSVKYKFALRKEERGLFPLEINENSGVISVARKIDHEYQQWINATVVAEDSGITPNHRKSQVKVSVKVIDENDNNPTFIDSISNVSITEDAPVGTIVAKLKAVDADSGKYGKVTYLLDRKSSGGKFSIDPDSGIVTVTESLDREEKSIYTLIIQAWDNFRFGYATGESRNAFKQITVQVTDVNDQTPYFIVEDSKFQSCSSVTEFHEDPIMTLRAQDDDDGETENGRVTFKIKSGNQLGLFKLEHQGRNVAKLLPARSLKGFYGNYTIDVIAQDNGIPSNYVTKWFHICVEDYNDQKPQFIHPSQNFTIKVLENTTIGSPIIQVRAIDSDIGANGIVRYGFRQDASQHWKAFEINETTGLISLRQNLDREQQKFYHIRVEAHDLGTPTPLSSELDLTILVKNVDDFKPMFTTSAINVTFTENKEPGEEKIKLPETVDSDIEDDEDDENSRIGKAQRPSVCYFLARNDEEKMFKTFKVHPFSHTLETAVALDREQRDNFSLTIYATENCLQNNLSLKENDLFSKVEPGPSSLKIYVKVADINDNRPRFTKRVFTGGVSTSTDYGLEFMKVSALDRDEGSNAKLKYFIVPPVNLSLSQGLSHLVNNDNPLFNIDSETGSISLAFDPQPDMKGHFVLTLSVKDGGGLEDTSKAFVYLLRDDQKVKIVARMNPSELRGKCSQFTKELSLVTGKIVNLDENYRFHENLDGSVDKTKTDFYVHFVHPENNLVMEAEEALKLIDINIERLDILFKDFNVLDTQANSYAIAVAREMETHNVVVAYAAGTALFLALVLLVVISLCFAQRAKYQRRLKAATASAYGSSSSILPRAGNVPNTNVHSMEGSNPIWMQAYQNTWYKEDSISENSESRDSLDENAIGTESSSPPSSHLRSFVGSSEPGSSGSRMKNNDLNKTYHRNLVYSSHIESSNSATCLMMKKHLETTEL